MDGCMYSVCNRLDAVKFIDMAGFVLLSVLTAMPQRLHVLWMVQNGVTVNSCLVALIRLLCLTSYRLVTAHSRLSDGIEP